MKHILVIDSKSKQNKALLALAKALKSIKVFTTKEWEAFEDQFMVDRIRKGLKTQNVSEKEVKKALTKMRDK